jgi:flagellar motor switch protein FliM
MNDNILSPEEVESLLSAMEARAATAPGAAAPSATGASVANRTRDKVTPYDFKRPERVGKDQMRSLQTLHEGFARNFAAKISALMRAMVEVKLTSVDQLTYSEFVFSLENPTCFNLIRATPLEGNVVLDINPSILYPIIDRLLGGGKEPSPVARRPLTAIELRLVGRITRLFLDELKHAWENVVTLELEVERVESNPQLAQILPPNEVVVLISFELTIQDLRGMMNLCIPFNSIERISAQLSSNSWTAFRSKQSDNSTRDLISRNMRGSLVEVAVQLAQTRITTADLVGLRVGDIITTEKDVSTPLVVEIEGIPKFQASPGAFKMRKAIQIEGPVP